MIRNTFQQISTLTILICISGCQTLTTINLKTNANQEEIYRNGNLFLKSEKKNSVATLSVGALEVENGNRIPILVNIQNLDKKPILFDIDSIAVNSENSQLKVYSAQELITEARKTAETQMALAAMAGAMNSFSAAYSAGQQTTYGTFNSNTFGSYQGANYRGSSYGSYSQNTYNPVQRQAAITAANAKNQADIDDIIETSSKTIENLSNNMIQKTTIDPQMIYGGKALFESVPLTENQTQDYTVTIKLGGDVHKFVLTQSKSLD